MKIFYYIISGLFGGVIGGMGMGGGSVTIPILVILLGVEQHMAQACNIIAFIPMAIISLIIHFKNKLIDKKDVLLIIIPALIFAVLGCLISKSLNGEILRKIFGVFLIILSVFEIFDLLKKQHNSFVQKDNKNKHK